MKKILLIAQSCYPVNGAEAIVNIKMLKALSESNDFVIDLVSRQQKSQNYPSDSLPELGVNVRNVSLVEVDNKISLSTIWLHFLSYLFFGVVFNGSHWAVKALPVVKNLLRDNEYDYVLTKDIASPLIGYYLKKHFGIKWVATINDPYPAYTYPQIYAEHYHAKKNYFASKMVKILEKYADCLIFPSDRLRRYMQNYIHIPYERTIIIPHAVNKTSLIRNELKNPELKIIHSGNLLYPRDPQVFLKGLRLFLDENTDAKISVTVQGVADQSLFSVIDSYGLKDYVFFQPPIPYLESLSLLKTFHVALIIEAQCPEGIFLPTKVSDFMQEGMSIFTVSPVEGVLHDLYFAGNISYFADNTDPVTVKDALVKMYVDFQNRSISPSIIPDTYKSDYIANCYRSL